MPVFVHLTPEQSIANIVRNGIKPSEVHAAGVGDGVFCMPVIHDFYASHQWLRELRRFNKKNMTAVYFKLGDEETVFFGDYHQKHRQGSAGQAVKAFLDREDRLGFQVIVPRKIAKNEILRSKKLSQTIGWRFYPKAKGTKRCLCPGCLRGGEMNDNKLILRKYEELLSELRQADESQIPSILRSIWVLKIDHDRRIKDFRPLLFLKDSSNPDILIEFVSVIAQFRGPEIDGILRELLEHPNPQVKAASAEEWLRLKGKEDDE
ncbi:HEAT repeat domain-containing protein [Paenibacillus ehimensis]|uniref:HEAT repeat domain-containing protein n=1 Tax=Paenibacillus ehimensis TaxID=79264 RepID=A0ABT8VH76_9BACL|nr:HEAT repeat domain-containing protein [Paenibacillus ehimensis]MDO3680343.1 HEAT repeat domain-containing protein [Paenibacillus ehimensis]MEC0211405.1 HEAT repeat domain-containing protein [Paenibacillus ehimensis]